MLRKITAYKKYLIIAIIFFGASAAFAKTYDRNKAISYHKEWYNKHNPNFYDYDNDGIDGTSDCTNYVSQILQAGGWANTTNNGLGSLKSWFYVSNSNGDREKDISSKTWRSPVYLYNRFNAGLENVEKVNNIKSLIGGDVVFIRNIKKNTIEHAMIVVARIDGDVTLGGHTNSRLSVPTSDFSGYMKNREFIGFHIKDLPPTTKKAVTVSINIQVVANSITERFLTYFLSIRSAFAQTSTSLFAYINQPYTVRVDGTGFDGNEAVSIDGSTCDKSTIQRGSGYFTQSCTGGSVAGDANKIRVYDTQYDLDIEVPTAYQTMQLRGPVIAPLAPALSEPTSGTIRLSWGAVSGATGYEISRTGQALTTVGAVTSYDDMGRTPGTMYCYRLRTIQNGTMSAYSPESCLTVNTLKCQGQWTTSQYNPGQAETRTLSCPSGQTGNISQTHTCQATGQWGTTSETSTCTVAPVASCTGSWSSAKYLVGQTEEKYENTCPAGTQGQVRSWHTCQASGTSAVWGGLAQSDNCTAYLAAPTNLAASSVIGGMQLSWSPASGATRYYIYKNGDANNYYSSVTGTSWIDANVVNGQSYSYALKAYSNLNNSSVYSPITNWVSKTFEAGNLTIDPPQNVTASQFTDGYGRKSIRLTWSTVPSVDSYYIYRRGYVNPNGNGEFLAAVNGVLNGATPEFIDYAQLNLISGNSYCYYIRAASGNNQSVNSYPDACSLAP